MQAGLTLTAIELVGDYGAKTQNAALAYGGYGALATFLMSTLKENPLSITNAYWDAFSNLMTLGLGVAMGETLTNKQLAGALLISGGIFLLQ